MRTFAFALGIASAAAFGTTGHYGNQYAHGGYQDHAHEDHIYGYDSVQPDLDLVLADNNTMFTNIETQVTTANQDRIDYITEVQERRERRLLEIKDDNDVKIAAPFQYQVRLLEEEEDDILQARNNAIRDSNDAYDDMEWRLDQLRDDIVTEMNTERDMIVNSLNRAIVDRKNVAKVFHALRIDWLREIDVSQDDAANTIATVAGRRDFTIYDGLFDNFHYDIGHGKGTGETAPLPDGPANDGYRNRKDPRQTGPVGDYEHDQGAKTWAWEMNGSVARGY